MGGIKDWVIGITGFILIMTVISHLINGKKYIKYIRLFMGLILILIVLSPVGRLFSIEDIYNDILRLSTGELKLNELQTELTAGLDVYTDSVMAAYKEAISENVEKLVSKEGYEVARIEADINTDENYGVLNSLKVFLSKIQKEDMIKINKIQIGSEAVNAISQTGDYIYDELREQIAGQFNLDAENIDIFVTEE